MLDSGETPTKGEIRMDQPFAPKGERIVSANPSPDAAIIGPPTDVSERSFDAGGSPSIVLPHTTYASHGEMMPYGGYEINNGYAQYLNAADGLNVSPGIFSDTPSIMFHSGYGFNPDFACGQYSPIATPLPSVMVDGSGYLVPFGSYDGESMPGTSASSPLTTPAAYSQPMGLLGSYENHYGKVFRQSPSHGYGLSSLYQHGGSYPRSNYGNFLGANDRIKLPFDKGRGRESNQDSIYSFSNSLGFDHSRGPRASKHKPKRNTEQSSSASNVRDNSSISGVQFGSYNQQDFDTDYKNAKFFIIKSFSEDNVHKSIKYGVWSSTPHGNKKLDAAYQEEKNIDGNCPIFLLFSVNASGQFCGVAEMTGPVDFEKDADYWQQDRWNGQFPVRWHVIKDVPNNHFRHILLENNDDKPVTHSRDTQEVKLELGIEMLKIFKGHDAHISILDDFDFYNQRERTSKERKVKQQPNSKTSSLIPDENINQISKHFSQALQFDDDDRETLSSDAISKVITLISPVNDPNTVENGINPILGGENRY